MKATNKAHFDRIDYKKLSMLLSVITLASSIFSALLSKAADIWLNAYYLPEKNMSYVENQLFEESRYKTFENFNHYFSKVRLDYEVFLETKCLPGKKINQSRTTKILG